ncbi:MAG: ATP-grasp domain-containing protein [Desulfomicrobium sp.]|nr:ATP-grasp domain-containing protein [Desulfomicrobium sp.]MDP3430622.1 ATP-grasp domain-containing protein [Desulfomicrobium sp.]
MTSLHVAVVREDVPDTASPDALDTVLQARSVCASLIRCGWRTSEHVLGPDPSALEADLAQHRPDVVFNLVESCHGLASLACVAPALFRKAGLAFTGTDEGGMALAGDKALARRLLQASGLPVPHGATMAELQRGVFPGPGTYIVKARFEDASLGLGPDCVVEVREREELLGIMKELAPRMRGDCVAEEYVHGREFNLALLAEPGEGVCVLPLAEMVFDSALPGPAILHYAAKWEQDSADYAASARSFDLSGEDSLVQEMKRIGLSCWELLDLDGYARIDFRVCDRGRAHVIDVNPNPCITPDAGFAAAARQAGLDHAALVRCIVLDALKRAGQLERAERV